MSVVAGNFGRPDLRKRVIDRLEHSIKMGGYRPDEKLPTEHELAVEFQVSRPIIRDVLQMLREKGLIYSRQGSGSYVKNIGVKPPLSFSPLSTRNDMISFYQFRLSVEPASAFLAATKISETETINLGIHLNDMQSDKLSLKAKRNAEYQFHALIAKASHNNFFATVIEALKGQFTADNSVPEQQSAQSSRKREEVWSEHQAIYQALRARDAIAAQNAVKLHVSNSLAYFETAALT